MECQTGGEIWSATIYCRFPRPRSGFAIAAFFSENGSNHVWVTRGRSKIAVESGDDQASPAARTALQRAEIDLRWSQEIVRYAARHLTLGRPLAAAKQKRLEADVSRKERHPFDRFYNFFSRSAWTVHDLAHQVAVAIVVRLNPRGLLYLVVDDTLLHKRGKHVYGLGWFRDAVASTAKRVATASGNHWVVVGLAICIPGTSKIYCLPIHAMLHLAGKNHKSEATLAKEMLQDILGWFPDRKLVFIGDGAYSANNLLGISTRG